MRLCSSAGKVTGYKPDGRNSIPSRDSSVRDHVQVGYGVHPVSYPTDTGDIHQKMKRADHEANTHFHLTLIQMSRIIRVLPPSFLIRL